MDPGRTIVARLDDRLTWGWVGSSLEHQREQGCESLDEHDEWGGLCLRKLMSLCKT